MAICSILNLSKIGPKAQIGEKARNLRWLRQHGFKIPNTFVIPFEVYMNFKQAGQHCLSGLSDQLVKIIDPQIKYAVRSSANLEDSMHHSFAGQFTTILDLQGAEAVLQRIQEVWKSEESATLLAYSQKMGHHLDEMRLAVIIQEMVSPVVSGVAFSKNPITGLSEIIVEAVRGSGEQLVQGGKTPDRWVSHWGKWITRPSGSDIDEQLIQRVVEQTARISQKYKAPVDLEWVYDGKDLYWVQLRPITQLDNINIFSCRISRELFPGMIKPLIWTVNIPLVNGAWIKLFTELIGPNDLKPEELAKAFTYRVYFNMGVVGRIFMMLGMPHESLEMLLGIQKNAERPKFKISAKTVSLIPRVVGFIFRKISFAKQVRQAIPEFRRELRVITAVPASQLSEEALLDSIQKLFAINQRIAYYNILVPLVMGIANQLLRSRLNHLQVDFNHFDLMDGVHELYDYDPKYHLGLLINHYNKLDESTRQRIAKSTAAEFDSIPDIGSFQTELAKFIRRFGHLSDSGNDFSNPPWRETPELIIKMVYTTARSQTSDQVVWQTLKWMAQLKGSVNEDQVGAKVTWDDLKVSVLQKKFLKPIYQAAQNFRLLREIVSSLYTYGYGLFRIYFLELGERMVARRVLEKAHDIFYLEWKEIQELIQVHDRANHQPVFAPDPRIAARQSDMQANQDTIMPEIIFGDELPPARPLDHSYNVLTGIPSSRGYYQGPAKVIRSVSDFDKLAAGDVLVIPYSDVSWTPLFTQAGAVVAESGGMLSHSSIVAREYQIPAVVSVVGAMRLVDGTLISVDGFKGEVIIQGTP